MKKESILVVGSLILVVLALAIGYIGAFSGPNVLLPPVITSIGFIVIAFVLFAIRKT